MADPMQQRLAQIRGRSEAATPGPWEADGYEGHIAVVPGPDRLVLEGVTSWREADAEFIAHARTDVDDLLAVVQDVLAIHVPVKYGADRGYPREWLIPDYVCDVCLTEFMGCVQWPCATVAAITDRLGGA